jgi:hypothetical protein
VEKVDCKVIAARYVDAPQRWKFAGVNERLAGLEGRLSECRLGPGQTFDDVSALEVEIGRQTARLLHLIEPVETRR